MFHPSLPAAMRALLILGLVVLVTGADAPEKKVRVKKLKGTVKEVSEGRMVITDAKENTDIALLLHKKCEIEVLGSSDVAYLTPGVSVHFLAEMTKSGLVPDPLKEITVCNLTEKESALCILADPTKPSNKGPDAVNQMEVRGTIKTNKNSKMTIDIPSEHTKKNQQVKVTLAPDIKVLARFTDLALVQPGDAVEVPSGTEQEPTLVLPRKVIVTLANPLVAAEKTDKKSPTVRKTTAKSGSDK
jgi:hypothetical protein